MIHTTSLDIHEFLEWLAGCDSRDEIHATIRAWLHANPRPPSTETILARIDEALAGWYQAYYDPRIVAPVVAELEELAARMARESGPLGIEFDAAAWVENFIHEPHPALGGRCPVHLLSTEEGRQHVHDLLGRQQSSAYS